MIGDVNKSNQAPDGSPPPPAKKEAGAPLPIPAPIPLVLHGVPRVPARPIKSLPHQGAGEVQAIKLAPKSVAETQKATRFQRIPNLLQAIVEHPAPDGDLKKNKFYPQLIRLFQVADSSDAALIQRALSQCAKDPQLKPLAEQLKKLFAFSEQLLQLIHTAGAADEAEEKCLDALANEELSFVMLDCIQARLEKSVHPFSETIAEMRPLIMRCNELIEMARKNDVGGFCTLYLAANEEVPDGMSYLSKLIEKNGPKEALDKVEQIAAVLPSVLAEIKGHMQQKRTIPAEATLRAAGTIHPDLPEVLLSYVEKSLDASDKLAFEALKLRLKSPEVQFVKRALVAKIDLLQVVNALSKDSPLVALYQQVKGIAHSPEFERRGAHRLDDVACMKLACAITVAQSVQAAAPKYLKKDDPQMPASERVARDVHFDWAKKEVYVIADSQASALQAKGTYKKVRSSAAILLERPKSPVEHVVQVTPVKNIPEPDDLAEITNELPFIEALQGIPGIPKVRSFTNLTTGAAGQLHTSLSMIVNKAEGGDLNERIAKGGLLIPANGEPSQALQSITKQVLVTYSQMHARNVIHGDTKLGNVLVDKNDKVIVTDYGFAYFVKPEQPALLAKSMTFEDSSACAPWWNTPFELHEEALARKAGTIQETALERDLRALPGEIPLVHSERVAMIIRRHKLVESFVVGSMLYQMAYGETEWMKKLMINGWPPYEKLTRASLDLMKEEYATQVREKLEHLVDNVPEDTRTNAEHYQWAVLKLMDVEEHRWTTQEASDYLERHLVQAQAVAPAPPAPIPAVPAGAPPGGPALD